MKHNFFRCIRLLWVLLLLVGTLTACDEEWLYDEEEGDVAGLTAEPETDVTVDEDDDDAEADADEDTDADEDRADSDSPTPAESTGDDTWLVMLYQDADDEILEKDIFTDLNEAEMVGSGDHVTIVAQLDRYRGAFRGDGNWTTTKRYLITQDDDLTKIASEEIEDLGEVDSGDWESLTDFAVWAIETYPAEHYVLILSDHGAGWVGGWNDDDPVEGSEFSTNHIDQALGAIIEQTGITQFDLVGFDACLMSQLEALYALVPYAHYAVASEEVEPSLGWAYSSFLQTLSDTPTMSAAELGEAIVASYITEDGRITDDEARHIFVSETFGVEDDVTAEEVAAEMSNDITLTAVDLTALPALNDAFNDLALALADVRQKDVAEARAYAQSFESVFGEDLPSPYLDLGHFTSLLQETFPSDAVYDAAATLQEAIAQAVVAEKHGEQRPGATGFTFYFPNSKLYKATSSASARYNYTDSASRFATASLWDDFLRFHYTKETFAASAADVSVLQPVEVAASELPEAPPVTEEIAAPGAGNNITIAPLELSAEEIGMDDTLTIGAAIQGDNIAYIYLYVSYYDEESDSFLTADMQYIGAEDVREIGGILYPDWGDEVGELEVEWEPTIYFMSDGETEEFAFFEPETYGATAEEDTYTVYGIYTFADGGNQRDALIRFGGDGVMQCVYGFTDADGTGAPHEITPQAGDTFTILEEWLEFEEDPEGEFVDYAGATLTFGDKPFEMIPYYAYAGNYTLGILVEDMNGDYYEEYAEVTVAE